SFGTLAVRLAAEDSTSIGRTDRHRHVKVRGGAIADAGRFGNDLVISRIDVVGELYLDDGTKPVSAHSDRNGDYAGFADRRVEAAGQSVLLLQSVGHAEDAAEIADVLTEDENVWVALEHDVQCGVERLDHVHGGHDQTPMAWRWRRRCQGISLKTS